MATHSHALRLGLLLVVGLQGLLLGGGCQTHRDPLAATPQTNPALLPIGPAGVGADEFIPAQFHLEIDPATLDYELTPARLGAAQPPQNRSYDFDIDQFVTPDTLHIGGVYRVGDSALQVYFTHYHPFPAPNLTLPPSASNRTDLGYTGRLLLIPGGAPSFYFNDEVRLVEGVIADADGYVNPGNLLANGPAIPFSNTFPYKLLVDEKLNNRPGISNDGLMTGSYDPASGGWQRANLGPNNTGWTGYDYLHGGQSGSNVFVIRNSALQSPSFSIDLALLIKYTDPRGAADITSRLPPETTDVSAFAYRLPYAAIDASEITVEGFPYVGYQNGAQATVNLEVRDWDAAAFTAPTHDLGSEPDVDRIQAGATGPPVGRLEIPALFDGSLPLSLMGSHTGLPNDELIYTVEVNNLKEPPSGYIYGLAEFVDPEDADPNGGLYRYGVDPFTLEASTGRALRRITYQQVQVTVADRPPDPTAPVVTKVAPSAPTSAGTCFDTAHFTVTVQGDAFQYYWSFPNGGIEGIAERFTSLPELDIRLSRPGLYQGFVVAIGNEGESIPFAFPFKVNDPGPISKTSLTIDSTIDVRSLSVTQSGVRTQIAAIDDATGALYHYRATKNIPDAPSQYARIQLDASTADSAPQLTLYNDRPVVIYKRTNGKARISIASSSTPSTSADWTYYSFPDTVDRHSEVIVRGNRLMFAYRNLNTGQLEVARASAAEPGVSDWIYYPPGNSLQEIDLPHLYNGSFAAYIFHHTSSNSILYNVTFSESPREQFDWYTQALTREADGRRIIDFFERDGLPYVTVFRPGPGDVFLHRGKVPFPNQDSDWTVLDVLIGGGHPVVANGKKVGERQVIGSGSGSTFIRPYLLLALCDAVVNSGDYWYVELDPLQGDFGTIPLRTLTPEGEPRLMAIYANGPAGLKQSVLDIDWH